MSTDDSSGGRTQYVYLMRRERDGMLKIGTSLDPVQRRSAVEGESGCPVELLTWFVGGTDVERDLHERFREYQHIGEWFADSSEIREYFQARGEKPRIDEQYRWRRQGISLYLGDEQVIANLDNFLLDRRIRLGVQYGLTLYARAGLRLLHDLVVRDPERALELLRTVSQERGGPQHRHNDGHELER